MRYLPTFVTKSSSSRLKTWNVRHFLANNVICKLPPPSFLCSILLCCRFLGWNTCFRIGHAISAVSLHSLVAADSCLPIMDLFDGKEYSQQRRKEFL